MWVGAGSVSLINSTISGNDGTGVVNGDNFGSLTATNSTISNNTGYGINLYGRVSLTNSTVSGNSAGNYGGGVFGNVVTVADSTISGNTGDGLGGVGGLSGGASVTANRSTISGNGGDGVSMYKYEFATLTNSTISGNEGRGVACSDCYEVSLTNTTVTGNGGGGLYFDTYGQQASVTLTRTVISGNTAADGAEVNNAGDSSFTAASFNLFGHSGLINDEAFENFTPGPTDITATSNGNDPTALANILNTTLANNGGPTRTHALPSGSPAVDAVMDTCPPPRRDQRGVQRPQDGNNDGVAICDIGSFERR